MKREREGGGKDQAEEGLGACSGQDTIPDALPPLPAEAAHQGTAAVGPTRSPPGL